ncbi:MAG: TIGR00730 family Rossman fold protein [Candidatus Anstonellaceae archaeon]
MTKKFISNQNLNNNISVLVPPARSVPVKITKSFFRKNGHHLDKYGAVENFSKDLSLILKLKEGYPQKVVAIYGSARISDKFYKNLADISYELGYKLGKKRYIISTGGGPGIMEYASKGAVDANSLALGFQPKFLEEVEKPIQMKNKIQYFVSSLHSRKILIANNAAALVFFPGGAGTVDEFFHYLNFSANGRMKNIPFILFNNTFWEGLIKWINLYLVQTGFLKKEALNNVFLVNNTKEAIKVIEKNSNYFYTPDFHGLSSSFKQDILQIYNYVEQFSHPSASYFGSLTSNYKYSRIKNLIEKITSILQKNNHSIYYSALNGFASFMDKLALKGLKSKNISNLNIPIGLQETQKLILGTSDTLIFYPGGLDVIDAFTEYVVRIQIGDMEKVPLNLVDPSFFGSYLQWFEKFPVNYGFAEKELITMCNIVSKPDQIILSSY